MNILNNKLKLACAIGAGIAGLISGFYWYHGAFSNVDIKEQKYGPCDFIYFNRIGSYQTIGTEWMKLEKDAHKYFTNVQFIGIYYDNPKLLDDPNQARVALGFSVGNREKDKIKIFLDNNPNYKFVQLPEVQSYSTSFSYKSSFSFKIVKEKIYPKITGYALEKNLSSFCLVETYLFQEQSKKINFDIPLGENSESYFLF
ncbi:GyrI-like small molecule-binding domain protein (macronuclear) [Tetrahymena thermophila SB210]|uniref:GyrI-like small molecule-binding domain protein n=1 Tax=Tetrahymena thermophila (strain SB210) TaxID=312017 RepID=I7M7P0_TETTS|nr:GyrI-like small molecule-binding domain protein [Tetrahymena thermophila SB210]EAR95009.1 GyrI-like small molecule-binding domain protein [Tetrahymena thermophila SB210]|eukprot:XP_001015254.1 GyrI-like small molecule-binding domain protein [Tetrahymena thermophila SB210]